MTIPILGFLKRPPGKFNMYFVLIFAALHNVLAIHWLVAPPVFKSTNQHLFQPHKTPGSTYVVTTDSTYATIVRPSGNFVITEAHLLKALGVI